MPNLNALISLGLIKAVALAARISMVIAFAPFFGGDPVPARVKAGLTVALTYVLYPVYSSTAAASASSDWFKLLLGEMMIGLMMGLAVQFVFEGIQTAGQITGFQLGYSLVNVIDPQTQVETPVLSFFNQTIAVLIFLQLDVHHWILRALGRSFEYVPPGSASSIPGGQFAVRAGAGILLVAVQIAAPVLLATMLADIGLGFISRSSPQLPVLFMGISIKDLLGMLVFWATLPLWPRLLGSHFQRAIQTIEQFLGLMRYAHGG